VEADRHEPALLLPVRSLLEEAAATDNVKGLIGNVRSFKEFLRPEVLDQVAAQSPGALGFLAFHPGIDKPITEYVQAGSMASDSGSRVLVFFTTDSQVSAPTYSDDPTLFAGAQAIPGVEVQSGVHPAYEVMRLLYEPAAPPALPGLALFKDFTQSEVVYVELAGLATPLDVAQRLRDAFALAAEHAVDRGGQGFADTVSAALQKQRVPHSRTGHRSLHEWFIKACQVVWDNKSDVIAVVTAVV
jgi:hypothetical protein